MKRNSQKKSTRGKNEGGNALIYVLIAIALFAALSMTFGRQTDTSEAGALPEERAEIYANQLISYAAQAKSAIDQMLFTGTRIDNLDFLLPTEATFNDPPYITKVYHPQGGGLVPGRIPAEATDQDDTDPVAGWYLGRFNNVEWTSSAGEDVILTAYQVAKQVCEKINLKITGTTTIPTLGDSIKEVMVDNRFYTGVNVDLTTDPAGTPICAACHKVASLCVEDQAGGRYGFYTIIVDQ
jgi:hypothetical protein